MKRPEANRYQSRANDSASAGKIDGNVYKSGTNRKIETLLLMGVRDRDQIIAANFVRLKGYGHTWYEHEP